MLDFGLAKVLSPAEAGHYGVVGRVLGPAGDAGSKKQDFDVMAVAVDMSNTDIFTAGVPQKLFTVVPQSPIGACNNWDVTPDGRRFLVVSNQAATVPPVTVVVNWKSGLTARERR